MSKEAEKVCVKRSYNSVIKLLKKVLASENKSQCRKTMNSSVLYCRPCRLERNLNGTVCRPMQIKLTSRIYVSCSPKKVKLYTKFSV